MRRIELYGLLPSSAAAVDWTRRVGILKSTADCPECSSTMQEVDDKCEDGTNWKCQKQVDGVRHTRKLSIRAGSKFFGSQLAIRDIVFVMYEWSGRTSIDQAAYELSISRPTVCA